MHEIFRPDVPDKTTAVMILGSDQISYEVRWHVPVKPRDKPLQLINHIGYGRQNDDRKPVDAVGIVGDGATLQQPENVAETGGTASQFQGEILHVLHFKLVMLWAENTHQYRFIKDPPTPKPLFLIIFQVYNITPAHLQSLG